MCKVYFEESHKLVRNTILALYELELTWDLRVCSRLNGLEHEVHKNKKYREKTYGKSYPTYYIFNVVFPHDCVYEALGALR